MIPFGVVTPLKLTNTTQNLVLGYKLLRTTSKLLAERVQIYKIVYPGFQVSSILCHHIEKGQLMLQLVCPGLDIISTFSGPVKMP